MVRVRSERLGGTAACTNRNVCSEWASFEFRTGPANQAPTPAGSLTDVIMTVGDPPRDIDLSHAFSDPDADDLEFRASSQNTRVATASVSGSTLRIRAVAPGSTVITVTSVDPAGLTALQTVAVTIHAVPVPGLPTWQEPELI